MTIPDTFTTDSKGASHKIFFTEADDYRIRRGKQFQETNELTGIFSNSRSTV
jgi:hypothetical protein